mgnify:FL=1
MFIINKTNAYPIFGEVSSSDFKDLFNAENQIIVDNKCIKILKKDLKY